MVSAEQRTVAARTLLSSAKTARQRTPARLPLVLNTMSMASLVHTKRLPRKMQQAGELTAMPVATPWPPTAPSTTPAGEDEAASAIVARKDLSPHSAANTSANVDSSSVAPACGPARLACMRCDTACKCCPLACAAPLQMHTARIAAERFGAHAGLGQEDRRCLQRNSQLFWPIHCSHPPKAVCGRRTPR